MELLLLLPLLVLAKLLAVVVLFRFVLIVILALFNAKGAQGRTVVLDGVTLTPAELVRFPLLLVLLLVLVLPLLLLPLALFVLILSGVEVDKACVLLDDEDTGRRTRTIGVVAKGGGVV